MDAKANNSDSVIVTESTLLNFKESLTMVGKKYARNTGATYLQTGTSMAFFDIAKTAIWILNIVIDATSVTSG
jgi:hypothetical protein